MATKIFLILVGLLFLVHSQTLYQKIAHNTDPNARCLDGSPAALYLHQGNPKKILFYFVGGASCSGDDLQSTLQHCYQRSKAYLGSSIYWPQTMLGQGILSRDAKVNFMADWTKVIFIYCDGAFHQGYTKDAFKYKDAQLYFRGALNTRSHFSYINKKFPFAQAQKVVLTGSSAGGIATYMWADYLKTLLTNPNTQYYSIPDSSMFLDPSKPIPHQQNYHLSSQYLNIFKGNHQLKSAGQVFYNVANRDQGFPNVACTNSRPQSPWDCLDLQTAIPFLQTQSLFVQSSYDQYLLQVFAGLKCLSQGVSGYSFQNCDQKSMMFINSYWTYYMKYLQYMTSLGHNVWSISCSWHATIYMDNFYNSNLEQVPMSSGATMQSAVYEFVEKGEKVLDIDYEPWPSNKPCAY